MNFRDADAPSNPKLVEPWDADQLQAAFPLPAEDANKYSRGVLTVIAGSKRYPGAACLTSRAGQLTGAGYTQLVSEKSVGRMAVAAYPSLVARDILEFDIAELGVLKPGSRKAVCIGPGFEPKGKRNRQVIARVLEQALCPVLVDGGALASLCSHDVRSALQARRWDGRTTVITPHAGEARRLGEGLGIACNDPVQLAVMISEATGAVTVLKGPDTLIAQGSEIYLMREGSAALAKAGTGDVLAGMTASLLAQGVPAFDAAVLGTTLHARAGNLAADDMGIVSVTPESLLDYLPRAISNLFTRTAPPSN